MHRDRVQNIHYGALLWAGFLLATASASAFADGGVTFTDLAAGGGGGLVYQRLPSPRKEIFDQLKRQPVFAATDFAATPLKVHGAPGVALLDYDGDGDLDIYVTNGPGAANSLFSNRLAETGLVGFVDVGVAAGVDATDQDSQGVCFGDIDNDGDRDLLVLGNREPNRLFENRGDGTFADISTASGVGGGMTTSTSCSMGDVNGDGLLDIAVANSYDDWSHQLPYFGEPFSHTQHNQLFLNTGGNVFADASASSGIQDLAGVPQPGTAILTWAIALVDIDLDGDVDLFTADDQTVVLPASLGGVDVGFNRFFENDGSGRFTDRTYDVGLDRYGAWMGLAFGDLDCNGRLDLFASNIGDYTIAAIGYPVQGGDWASRWFLGQDDGTFTDPGVGDLVTLPFGWGNAIADYDNDSDLDIIFHGGFDLPILADASNPGVILANQGCPAGGTDSASFTLDTEALAGAADHARRTVHGMAVGDLDDNGFVDVVSVSAFDAPEPIPLVPYPVAFGSPFDDLSKLIPTFLPTANPGEFTWSGIEFANGSLAVDLSSGGNGNRWVAVDLLGTVGLTSEGRVNRDGIGAVVTLSPVPGHRQRLMQPVVGGASYGSQDSLTAHFGLGDASRGTVEVLWPGGVRNRLYQVRPSERILFPEIPCSFDGEWARFRDYFLCVSRSLDELVDGGVLDHRQQVRFLASAVRSFLTVRGLY